MTTRQILGVFLLICSAGIMGYLLWFYNWGSIHRQTASVPTSVPDTDAHTDTYADRDWSQSSNNALNISVFVFRDRNRNGIYDVGDLPMASVTVELTRPDGSTRRQASNINGYTNFSMSDGSDQHDITTADQDYRFDLLLPPGWTVTSANQRQNIRFKRIPGAAAGIVAAHPPAPIGLAPDLSIRSRIKGFDAELHTLFATAPDGTTTEVSISEDGSFSLTAYPGQWQLQLLYSLNGQTAIREIDVNDAPVVFAAFDTASRKTSLNTREVVQDFEYQNRSFIDKIPIGNLGLGWDYLLAIDNQHYTGPGYVNVLRSGAMVGYNSSGHPVTITNSAPGTSFDFIGAYFGIAWPAAEGETLLIKAWRGNKLVADESLKLTFLGPVWFEADYRDITRLELASEHYWQFVTEDMRFRLP